MKGPANSAPPQRIERPADAEPVVSSPPAMSAADARIRATLTESDSALPLQRVYHWEKERANKIFLTQPIGGNVRDWTWAQTMDEVRRAAAWIVEQEWEPGSRIAILSKNCAYWMMAELAIWMAGHVSVPVYPSLMPSSVRKLFDHCAPVACFIGAVDDASVATEGIPPETVRVRFPTAPVFEARTWESIIADTQPMTSNPVRSADDLATIIYTSGTTGTPKGVMHRFRAFSYFVAAGLRVFGEGDGEERMLSYLPLAHIAERALVESSAFYLGVHVFFVENLETFRDDLKRARPTIFFSVPRLFLKFQQGVLAKIPQPKLDRLLRLPIVKSIVRKRILRELGLDAARFAASGGAPLPLATLLWFRKVGLNLVEGYGMTETGITHTPEGGRCHPGYVGNGVPGVETKIAENGEILVKSPMNMLGYYKNPEGTAEAFAEDGFFRTGDLGELDADGWLKIIGRVKEQFKTSKGKYVSPAPIEKLIGANPAVEACCVMGAGMPRAFAIVLLSQEMRDAVQSADARRSCEEELSDLMEQVNTELEPHERIQFIVVTDEPWTIRNGFLTPTMKLKRNVLEDYYAESFAAWNLKGSPIVWHETRSVES